MTLTFASDLVRDFLSTAESVAAGVPANNLVKKQSLSDLKVAPPPRLVVEVKEEPSETPSQRKSTLLFSLMLTCETKAGNRAQAETWMLKIRRRMQDRPTFAAWIVANRTTEQRTGWQIRSLRVYQAEEDFESEDEDKTFTLALPMRLTLRIA